MTIDPDACYAAVARRDASADGIFVTAVRTTGIYCRPICPARLPLRRNVSFYASAAGAQAAGYRPCLRCRPESAPDSRAWVGTLASINRALQLIEDGALCEGNVDALAGRLGMTARHLRRLFHKHVGAGPLSVEQTRRAHLALKLIHETSLPFTSIALAAGYGSIRRFNESLQNLFGSAPSLLRRRPLSADVGLVVRVALLHCPATRSWRVAFPVSEFRAGACAELEVVTRQVAQARLLNVPLPQIGRAIAHVRRSLATLEFETSEMVACA
ncbi:MAG: bifunctional transcriptional activator/DNA repair enzyme AdaA [Hyphomicrobiaceae bacterium]